MSLHVPTALADNPGNAGLAFAIWLKLRAIVARRKMIQITNYFSRKKIAHKLRWIVVLFASALAWFSVVES